jgi:hypothetical protein
MMDSASGVQLDALNILVRKYREIPFASWETIYPDVGTLVDHSSENPSDDDWWQAHTDVLEIGEKTDGRRFARISIVLYPNGHAIGPAPTAWLAVYDDGRVEGAWANGDEFEFLQLRSGAV